MQSLDAAPQLNGVLPLLQLGTDATLTGVLPSYGIYMPRVTRARRPARA